MSVVEKLKNLNLPSDAVATLTYSEGTDVFVHNETEVETALEETSVVSMLCDLITTPGLKASDAYGTEVLESLRDTDLLENYQRDGTFTEYLTETINENFYDIDVVEYSVEKYDYKRGFCTLSTQLKVPVYNLIEVHPSLVGWEVVVQTDYGKLSLNS
tara:strand:- start:3354 stop:3827 length:474 start_codon:yes stop_codon:yes gene_type:complete